MPKVHNFDIYPHSGDRSCLGCVEVPESAEAPDDESSAAGGGSGASSGGGAAAEGAAATGAGEEPAAETPPPGVVLQVEWSSTTLALGGGEPVTIGAAVADIPDGEAARLTIRDRAGVEIVTLEGSVSGGRVEVEWTPELPEGAVPEVVVEVEAMGRTATSDVMQLTSSVELTILDAAGAPVVGARCELVLANGQRVSAATDEAGLLKMAAVYPGEFELASVVPAVPVGAPG